MVGSGSAGEESDYPVLPLRYGDESARKGLSPPPSGFRSEAKVTGESPPEILGFPYAADSPQYRKETEKPRNPAELGSGFPEKPF
jgi:hypothetical protein